MPQSSDLRYQVRRLRREIEAVRGLHDSLGAQLARLEGEVFALQEKLDDLERRAAKQRPGRESFDSGSES